MSGRAYSRFKVHLDVLAAIGERAPVGCTVYDFCRGGMFLNCDVQAGDSDSVERGETVSVQFVGAAGFKGRAFALHGTIVRVADHGYGIAFNEAPDESALNYLMSIAEVTEASEPAQAPALSPAASPELIAEAATLLRRSLSELFDLFVARAASNLEQDDALSRRNWRGLMEAQQNLHKQHETLAARFVDSVVADFTAGLSGVDVAPRAPEQGGQLALVGEEEFQDWLTITTLVSRLESLNEEALFELEQRLGALFGQSIQRESNPVGPFSIAHRFHPVFAELQWDESMESLAFKGFEHVAVSRLGDIYQQLNRFLAEHGILPQVEKRLEVVRPAGEASAGDAAEAEAGDAAVEVTTAGPAVGARRSGHAAGGVAAGSGHSAPAGTASAGGGGHPAGATLYQFPEGGGQPAAAGGGAVAGAPASVSATDAGAPGVERVVSSGPSPDGGGSAGEMPAGGMSGYGAARELLQLQRTHAHGPAVQAGVEGALPPSTSTASAASGDTATATGEALSPRYSPQEVANGLSTLGKQGLTVAAIHQRGGTLSQSLAEVLAPKGGDKTLPPEFNDKLEVIENLLTSIQSDPVADGQLKQWLERVEYPVIKTALENEEMLRDKQHPLYQLINLLDRLFQLLPEGREGAAGEAWTQVDGTLQRLSQEAAENPEVFDEEHKKLEALYTEQFAQYEQRVQEVVNKCKSEPTVRQATLEMLEDIDKLFDQVEGRKIPVIVLELFDAGWKNLLWNSYRRHGRNSDAYRAHRATIGQLIARLWGKLAAGPQDNWSDRQLRDYVEQELARVTQDKAFARKLVAELAADLRKAQDDIALIKTRHRSSLKAQLLQSWKQQKAAMKPQELSDKAWHGWLDRARAMVEGDLVNYRTEKGETQHQRLVWIDKPWERYVFVDREGFKGLDIELETLARDLYKDVISLQQGMELPLMDRASYSMLQSIHDRLLEDAYRDPLTGLLSRRGFEKALQERLDATRESGEHHVLCYLDLDRFNVVNTTCGHDQGDLLLVDLTRILRQQFGEEVLMGRLGGDEFAVLMESCSNEEGLRQTKEAQKAIRQHRFTCENQDFSLSASFGLASVEPDVASVRDLLSAVDAASFAAKDAGRDRIEFHGEGNATINRRQGVLDWVGRINKLFDAGLIQLKCQKIVPLRFHNTTPNYEVLLHVHDEQGNEVELEQFIEAAEVYNRILDIDRWVVDQVFGWMKKYPKRLNRISDLSVNLSGRSVNDEDFMDALIGRLERQEVPPGKLCFEVTETAAIGNLEHASALVRRLKQLGCKIAIDDFGTGQSSYAYLKLLPVDYVKIDGSFIRNISTNVYDYSVVKSIHEMGRALGKATVAEYVENEFILAKLRNIGIDYVQGFGIEKPIPLETLMADTP